ncbi:MAG: hypothetical protein P4K98_07920 [Bryobacteraceae bacterium]|nr:hypothetical protein [Bryobacteraceae bacterium]
MSCPLVVEAAQVVLILRPDSGSWQIREAEKITVNDKDKVRTGSTQKLELRADEYKKLPLVPILRGGAIIRRHAGGYFVFKNGASWDPLLPDGASAKGPVSYAELWSSARIAIQPDRDKKNAVAIRPGDLFAVLQGSDGNEALANLLTDETNFRGVGESDASAAFEEWKSALVALAPSVKGPAGARIQQKLLTEMQSADQKLKKGIAHNADLELGLKYAAVSRSAYPQEDRQQKARLALEQMKDWRDRQIAILRAFSAAGLWDAFVDKYGDFERWDNSFDEIKKLHEKAFIESANQHRTKGQSLEKAMQFNLALKEAQLAQLRLPGDQDIATWVETLRLKDAGVVRKPTKIVDRNSPEQVQVRAHLRTADRFIGDKQCDDAENSINRAVVLDRESPAILLSRAKLAKCRNQLLQALEILNEYDKRVTASEEREQSEGLRTDVNYDLQKAKQTLKGAIAKAKADGDYVQRSASAEKGLELDGNDLDFLLEAGLGRAILRKSAEAEVALNAYLRLSQAPGHDTRKRQEVYGMVSTVKESISEPQGAPNWFSGYKSPPGVFYCPISLMPNARPADVRASHKQSTSFRWNGDALSEVHVATELPGESGFTAYFEYFADGKSVRRVSDETIPESKGAVGVVRFTPNGPVGAGHGVYTVLLDNPQADPLMIERLTGDRVATIVAGNPYFHPFVWKGIYAFIAEYDDQGRVKSARQILTPDQKGTAHAFELRWDGLRLMEITERGTGDYRRTMTYSGGKLSAETISFHGKDSKIEYRYKGDQLVEASCGDDPSIDGRSRHVTFR